MKLFAVASVVVILALKVALAPLRAEESPPTKDDRLKSASRGRSVEQRDSKEATISQEPSREVQRALLQKMKSKKPEVRTAAVRELSGFSTAEAGRFLVQHGLGSGYGDVRKAAYETLLEMNEAEPVAGFLLDTVGKEVKRSSPREAVCGMLAVMLASSDADIERRALELFDKTASQAQAGVLLVLSLVDELGSVGGETSVETLMKISKRPVFSDRFAVRRAVVQSLTRITLPKSVESLVALLGTATGEVRGDIVRHLATISGQDYGPNPQAWAAWWKAQQGKVPRGAGLAISMADAVPLKSTYYGMPIYAARLVFVLDTSASMSGLRIIAAKRELCSAIASLPEGTYFNVLAFDMMVWPWSDQLMPSSANNKAEATAWVLSRGLGTNTASYNALEAAFAFDTETIYFLTDGQPAGGKIDNPAVIVDVLSRLNQTRRLTINSIGVGVGLPGPANPFDLFLAGLSARNYGEYRRVDQ
jgi:hypothetical protein